jgi:hypothetical protein
LSLLSDHNGQSPHHPTALSMPTSPSHISVSDDSAAPYQYHADVDPFAVLSSISQRNRQTRPPMTPLAQPRGASPGSDLRSSAAYPSPGAGNPSPSVSVTALQAEYQALYQQLVDLATVSAMIVRQQECLRHAALLTQTIME